MVMGRTVIFVRNVAILLAIIVGLIVVLGGYFLFGDHRSVVGLIDCGGFKIADVKTETFQIGAPSTYYDLQYQRPFNLFGGTRLDTDYQFPADLKPTKYETFEKHSNDSRPYQVNILVSPRDFSESQYEKIAACVKSHISEMNNWIKTDVSLSAYAHIESISYTARENQHPAIYKAPYEPSKAFTH